MRAVFDDELVSVIVNELPRTHLAQIAPFARNGLAETVPCLGFAAGTSDARFSLHIHLLTLQGELQKRYRASRINGKLTNN
jgi:hypothetical protein